MERTIIPQIYLISFLVLPSKIVLRLTGLSLWSRSVNIPSARGTEEEDPFKEEIPDDT